MDDVTKCPFTGGMHTHTNRDWWPNQLDVRSLHRNSTLSDPMGEAFDYAKEFKSLDLNAVIKDLHASAGKVADSERVAIASIGEHELAFVVGVPQIVG